MEKKPRSGPRNHNASHKRGKGPPPSAGGAPDGRRLRERPSRGGRPSAGHVGFKFLEKLARSDNDQILSEFSKRKSAIMDILQKPIDRLDMYPLILEMASKVCGGHFPQLKLEFILDVSNSSFVGTSLLLYLSNLPYVERKRDNSLYWNDQEKFWENLIVLLETITTVSPSTARTKCRALVDNVSKCSLESLRERHGFDLPERCRLRLEALRGSFARHEAAEKPPHAPPASAAEQPPESFRRLPLLPTDDDLLHTKPFVRPNIAEGAYADVDHYLDVQFRLLREDCFKPVREGIQQYLRDGSARSHYDGVRVFKDVTFAEPYVSAVTFGNIVEVDRATKRSFANIKWEYNKRFLFGALLLLTKDNCQSFIVATVADREPQYLSRGKIPISIRHGRGKLHLNSGDKYLMIESEVYFEPYYRVLKALQDESFPENLAMKKYIVDVETSAVKPSYLDAIVAPTAEETGLNESQYEALQLALTHEFAVIQGPPGTGKTFLGVEVAKHLLRHVGERGCRLLLICYTNHALDQFLGAILKVTPSVVRVGGQSRVEALKQCSLNSIRSQKSRMSAHPLYYVKKDILKNKLRQLRQLQTNVASLESGIVSSNVMAKVAPSRVVGDDADSLARWLFATARRPQRPVDCDVAHVQQALRALQTPGDARRERAGQEADFDIADDDVVVSSQICCWSLEKEYERLLRLLTQLRDDNTPNATAHIRCAIEASQARIEAFQHMRARWEEDEERGAVVEAGAPMRLPMYSRWKLYFQWTIALKEILLQSITDLQEEAAAAHTEFEEARMILDLQLIRNYSVVGMTTTGAARLHNMIRELAPPIIIVEEAAEVLEQHVVTSLHRECRHLILIGDERQLRPKAASMPLAKHYNIEVSLFERMINNNMDSRRLTVQHRMRPDFADLLCPHIYPHLSNHPSVESFPSIRGLCKSLFFFTHDHEEKSGKDSTSKMNSKEADVAVRLANYLRLQGYEPDDVTILCAYAAQMFHVKQEKKQYPLLEHVNVTVVDNYQGEESKIIILSLVRNNLDGHVGFLATPNRVCVALSRAREGFYMLGNIAMLKARCELWRNIAATLEAKGAVGSSLQLQCHFHPQQTTRVVDAADFDQCPEGGCRLKCGLSLPCGHACPLVCHARDRNHERVRCVVACERTLCEAEHVCPLPCAEKCRPCQVVVNKRLPCGHDLGVTCCTEPKDAKCPTPKTVALPCGHEAQAACYVDVAFVTCSVPCESRLPCGHACADYCHLKTDPHHEKTTCEKPCAKAKRGCTFARGVEAADAALHRCQKMCYEACDDCKVEVKKGRQQCKHWKRVPCNTDVDAEPCRAKCARLLPCGHHCKRKCHQPCGGCAQLVEKTIPGCEHRVKVQCAVLPTRSMCVEECGSVLPCGHRCPRRCKLPCAEECERPSGRRVRAPCGHAVLVPCKWAQRDSGELGEALLKYCEAPCDAVLACEHACSGSCSSCLRGRLHAACASKCDKDLICGHRCVEPCSEVCPPCDEPCEVKCAHSKCASECGSPCVPCEEPCGRRCEHGACDRRCGQPCSLPPCAAPCPRLQPCGHPCRGLCGHPCPPVCRPCDPTRFPKDFLGDDYEDDAALVLLEDCRHVMAVEELDAWMRSETQTIGIKACPMCRQPILNSYRYRNEINETLRGAINPIKEKVYGTQEQIGTKLAELDAAIARLTDTTSVAGHASWGRARDSWLRARDALVRRRKARAPSLMQVEMGLVYADILRLLLDKEAELADSEAPRFVGEEFAEGMNVLCEYLVGNVKKISPQQQRDIEREMNRLHAMLQLAKLMRQPAYRLTRSSPDTVAAVAACRAVVFGVGRFVAADGMAALTALQAHLKTSAVVVAAERAMVVRAIGLKAGHWFKCPAGHLYCIGECGGATQVGTCPECRAPIGGTAHRLLPSNSHAAEMDGSRFPAWSPEYNDMANFHIDFDE